jgi:hypothetical protein
MFIVMASSVRQAFQQGAGLLIPPAMTSYTSFYSKYDGMTNLHRAQELLGAGRVAWHSQNVPECRAAQVIGFLQPPALYLGKYTFCHLRTFLERHRTNQPILVGAPSRSL